MSGKTMILIDGHALAFRSYYALERTGMKTTDMQPTWAVYGFFKAIFDLLNKINETIFNESYFGLSILSIENSFKNIIKRLRYKQRNHRYRNTACKIL